MLTLAQVGIGTGASAPDASAQLEVKSTSRGFLPPRVALAATNNASSPITSPVEGLIVYNTATAGTAPNNVTPGFYYYSGSAWVRMADRKSTVIARKTGDETTYASVGVRNIQDWSETVDVNNDFNPTTGVFTAPRTGYYIFNFSFSTSGVDFNDNSVLECQMVCSNSSKTVKTITSLPVSTPGSNLLDIGGQVSVVVNLTAAETVRPAVYHNVATSIKLKADSDFNHLSIVEL
jgi:hypothetical protein